MNFLLVSDTHGDISKITEMYERLNPSFNFDMILHCGDFASDAIALKKYVDCDVEYVQGNCDGCYSEDIKLIDTPAGTLMITHGHMEDVNEGLMKLNWRACELGCRCACYGHTHIPEVVPKGGDDVLIVNPGSLTKPLGGSRPSCAVIVADVRNGFTASIINY